MLYAAYMRTMLLRAVQVPKVRALSALTGLESKALEELAVGEGFLPEVPV